MVSRISDLGGDLVAHAQTVLRAVPDQRHECTQHLGLRLRVDVLGLKVWGLGFRRFFGQFQISATSALNTFA